MIVSLNPIAKKFPYLSTCTVPPNSGHFSFRRQCPLWRSGSAALFLRVCCTLKIFTCMLTLRGPNTLSKMFLLCMVVSFAKEHSWRAVSRLSQTSRGLDVKPWRGLNVKALIPASRREKKQQHSLVVFMITLTIMALKGREKVEGR